MRLILALLAVLPIAGHAAPAADAQREPELKGTVQHAIDAAECFEDRYDSAVWYKMMEPRLRKRVPDRDERMAILKNVFCEANRAGETRIPPGLVMAIMALDHVRAFVTNVRFQPGLTSPRPLLLPPLPLPGDGDLQPG